MPESQDASYSQNPTIEHKSAVSQAAKAFETHLVRPGRKLAQEIIESRQKRNLREDVSYIQETYGVKIKMGRRNKTDDPRVTVFEKVNLSEASEAVRVLRQELNKYPPSFLKNFCRLDELRIGKNLKARATEADESYEVIGGYFPRKGKHKIYLSTDPNYMNQIRHAFHHELFHLTDTRYIEMATRSKLQEPATTEQKAARKKLDQEWADLNPEGTKSYAKDLYDDIWGRADPQGVTKGFAQVLARQKEEEDRASCAQLLMAQTSDARRWSRRDIVLNSKLNRILGMYYERSNGMMDQQYFDDLFGGKIKEGYWQERQVA